MKVYLLCERWEGVRDVYATLEAAKKQFSGEWQTADGWDGQRWTWSDPESTYNDYDYYIEEVEVKTGEEPS